MAGDWTPQTALDRIADLLEDGTARVRVPQGIADSLYAAGEANAPAAGAAICTLAAPPAGAYEVTVSITIESSAAADVNNLELRRAGAALFTPLAAGGSEAIEHRFRVTLDGAQNLSVNAIGIGTAVMYFASITATRRE